MTSRTPTRPLLSAFAAVVLLAAISCSSDRNEGGTIRRKVDAGPIADSDAGSVPLDGGTTVQPDAGPACNCTPVPGERISPPPNCCSGFCSADGRPVDPATGCQGRASDGGVVGNDGGTAMTCAQNASCPGANPVCVDPQTFDLCNGTCAGGQCATSCDPFSATTGCGIGSSCGFAGLNSQIPMQGLCVPTGSGGEQAAACTAMFDAQGNPTSSTCNASKNFFCLGASPQSPSGTCGRLCRPTSDTLCPALGNYTCVEVVTGLGLCLSPPPAYTDIGTSCQNATQCQGNLCSPELVNSCSASCSGLAQCPSGSACISVGGPAFCAKSCTAGAGGDTACRNLNSMTICEDLGDAQNPLPICIPACTMDGDCGGAPGSCNVGTGHCGP